MGVVVVTPPSEDPITVGDALAHLRLFAEDDDGSLVGYIKAATRAAEEYSGRSFIARTLRLELAAWAPVIPLPRGPALAVTSVAYTDANGADVTVPSGWFLDASEWRSELVWAATTLAPSLTTDRRPNAFRVTYTAGLAANAADLARDRAEIRQAILIHVAHRWRFRDEDAPMPSAFYQLLDAVRVGHV